MKRLLVVPFLLAASLGCQAQDDGPTLARIAERGTLYLGHTEAGQPFSYVQADRVTPAGYSWEICSQVAKAIEARIGKPIQVVPVVTSANSRYLAVKAGIADIDCGASANTLSRQKQNAFSVTFFVSELKVMVRGNAGVHRLGELAGKRVVTTSGTMADRQLRQAGLQRDISFAQQTARNAGEAMALLEAGQADAFVADDATLASWRAQAKAPADYVLLPESLSADPYALVLPRDDPQFKALVDGTLTAMMRSGEMARLYDKWFMQPIPPQNIVLNLPMSALNKAAFDNPSDRGSN